MILSVGLNCNTDFSKASTELLATVSNIIDDIDANQSPLKDAGTLPNTLLAKLMSEILVEFALEC